MRRIVLVLGFAMAACSSSDGNGDPKPCTPTLGGACGDPTQEACDCNVATRVIFCDGDAWQQEADCALNNQICGAGTPAGNFTCVVDPTQRVPEFDLCQGTGAGNCESGLTCLDMADLVGLDLSLCVTDCDPTVANTCGATRECNDFLAMCTNTLAAREEACLLNGEGCVTGQGLECDNMGLQTYAAGSSFWCKHRCPTTEVGLGQGTVCAAGEECLASNPGVWDFELDGGGQPVLCPNGTECTIAQGYGCETFTVTGGTVDACARHPGWCGTPATMVTDFSDAAMGALTDADTCNYPGENLHCKPYAAASAEVACAELNSGFAIGPCTTDADCDANTLFADVPDYAAGLTCVDFIGGSQCGWVAAACVAFCEDENQQALTCPVLQYCGIPENGVGFPIIQNPPNGQPCPGGNTDCDQLNDFECVQFLDGPFCARNRKTCQDCRADNETCGSDAACCASTLGVCDATSGTCKCRGLGAACTGAVNECCAGACDVGGTDTCCLAAGACTANTDCCSNSCDIGGTGQCN